MFFAMSERPPMHTCGGPFDFISGGPQMIYAKIYKFTGL